MTWRVIQLGFSLILVSSLPLFAQQNQAELYHRNPKDPVTTQIPTINAGGKYELSALFTQRRITVRALLYIPPSVSVPTKRPVIVFVHGGAGNANYYKNNVGFMIDRANRKKFVLLSIQNYWGLSNKNMDLPMAMYHTAKATSELLEGLLSRGVISNELIFATGHSSGGFTAVATALYRPDLFTGFGANKANFYESDLMEICIAGEKVYYDRIEQGKPVKSVMEMKGTSTLGGVGEAERVKYQTPALRAFLKDQLGIDLRTQNFPKEGHDYSEADFDFFWSIVE